MKLRKVLAAALALVMVVAAPVVAKAELVSEDTTFTDKVADGTNGWNSGGTGVTFPINEDGVTVVFANDAFTRTTANWDNFVIETILVGAPTKGITLRADAYGWTYPADDVNTPDVVEDADYTHVPTYVVETSWGTDWTGFAALTDDTTVTVNAKKTSDTTIEFYITFASDANAWEKYTVTYPNGVPADLSFQIGADGGKVTLTSVDFPEPAPAPAPSVPNTGDFSMVLPLVLVLMGGAVVIVASKKRFA